MEQQFASRRQQLEQEAAERNRLLLEQHERNRQQSMAELEQIRQEGLRVQRESQAEAERLQNDALQFRQQTQQQCEQLISRSRQEASSISEGANRYAEQVLSELEARIKELGQVVVAGRRELVRLQVPDATVAALQPAQGPSKVEASNAPGGSVPGTLSKRRRVANTLRQMAG
jgi:dsDNA-specific endonuclease/ATPase MutS2